MQICHSISGLEVSTRSPVSRSPACPESALPVEIAGIEAIVLDLYGLLDDNDLEAEDRFVTLQENLEGGIHQDAVVKMRQQINALDFDRAKSSLGEIAEKLGIRVKGVTRE